MLSIQYYLKEGFIMKRIFRISENMERKEKVKMKRKKASSDIIGNETNKGLF